MDAAYLYLNWNYIAVFQFVRCIISVSRETINCPSKC